jgi:hypothetical protein
MGSAPEPSYARVEKEDTSPSLLVVGEYEARELLGFSHTKEARLQWRKLKQRAETQEPETQHLPRIPLV